MKYHFIEIIQSKLFVIQNKFIENVKMNKIKIIQYKQINYLECEIEKERQQQHQPNKIAAVVKTNSLIVVKRFN